MGQGGAAEIVVDADRVIIRWRESAERQSLAELGTKYLQEGDYEKGIGLLRRALERDSKEADALFNLGMALGDQGEAQEALELLERLVDVEPGYPGSWLALGVARARASQWEEAIRAFEEAVARDGQDGLARKNLGGALSQVGRLSDALEHLKAAVVLLPTDPQAWLNLGMNLEQSGVTKEAVVAYQRVMALAPGSQLSEAAELGRNRISTTSFRSASGGELGPDVVSFCGDALRLFKSQSPEEVQRITHEIATLGTKGLSLNDPSGKYTLRSLPGNFSGMQLLCIEFVGFKILDPTVDLGFDITAEYEEALRLQDEEPGA